MSLMKKYAPPLTTTITVEWLSASSMTFGDNANDLTVLYFYGERWPCNNHARMRIECSKLKADLCYNLHVVNNPSCTCGATNENAKHFVLYCPLYNNIRVIMVNKINNKMPVMAHNILIGRDKYNVNVTRRVLKAVQEFISDSH
jgi:hypothetical protein